MTVDRYRSYVIRVRRSDSAARRPAATRLDVEDLLDGGSVSISGPSASWLADRLELLLRPASGLADATTPVRSGDGSGDPPAD